MGNKPLDVAIETLKEVREELKDCEISMMKGMMIAPMPERWYRDQCNKLDKVIKILTED